MLGALLLVGSTANFLTDLYSAAPSLDEHHVDLKAGCEQEKGLRRWLCEATVHIPLPPIEVDVPVVGIEVITLDGLACGERHTAALLSTGNVFTWGWNDDGQLGASSGGGGSVSAIVGRC